MTWGEPGDIPGTNERRDGNGRRLQDQLADHQRNPFAHGELVDRLARSTAEVTANIERRVSDLERFAARVVVLGLLGGLILGGVAGVVAARLLGALH